MYVWKVCCRYVCIYIFVYLYTIVLFKDTWYTKLNHIYVNIKHKHKQVSKRAGSHTLFAEVELVTVKLNVSKLFVRCSFVFMCVCLLALLASLCYYILYVCRVFSLHVRLYVTYVLTHRQTRLSESLYICVSNKLLL